MDVDEMDIPYKKLLISFNQNCRQASIIKIKEIWPKETPITKTISTALKSSGQEIIQITFVIYGIEDSATILKLHYDS